MIVVCDIDSPRSAIISTRSRRLSLYRRYQRTHRMMMSRSKCRPLNRPSTFGITSVTSYPLSTKSGSLPDSAICTRACPCIVHVAKGRIHYYSVKAIRHALFIESKYLGLQDGVNGLGFFTVCPMNPDVGHRGAERIRKRTLFAAHEHDGAG